jgi:GBP family porin
LNGGRIGFRGTEQMEGGLKAGFVVEYGINLTAIGTANTSANANADTTAGEATVGQTMANLRQGYVNLSSATLGTVAAGTQYAYHDATSGAIAGSSASGGTNNVVGAANLLKYGYTGGQPRLTSAVSYVSPTFSGVTLKGMYNAGKTVSDSSLATAPAANTNDAKSYAVDYVNGPLKAGLAQTKYANLGAPAGAGTTKLVDLLGAGADQTGSGSATAADMAQVTNRVGGAQYDFGRFRAGLNRGTYEAAFIAAAKTVKSTATMGTVAVPFGKTTLIGGYTTGTIAQGGTDVYKTKAFDMIAVYDLSKRTNLYALAVQTKYDAQAASPTAGTNGNAKQYQYGVGVRHSF